MRYAVQARKSLPNEPLTHLLRAQAAQLSGDKSTARRIFEAMLAQPDTEQLGLRGLFLEAQREGELEAARQFAERALALNPKLGWSTDALFELQCKSADWPGALQTLASAKKHGHVDKSVADRRRAVLLTAQAQKAEDADPERALGLAMEAHTLAPGLVPAAAIAGRLLASRGNTPKAAKVLQKTWLKAPHPDLAAAYAYARVGDSPRDRLDRVRQLANMQQNSLESAVAVARTAIEARDFGAARAALEPLLSERLTQRVATLMARIEHEEHGNKGRVREWLARAANATRDPAWTADGVVSETWAPVSPVTGQLDAFQWRVPVEATDHAGAGLLADSLEDLMSLGAPLDAIDSSAVTVTAPVATPPAPSSTASPAAGGSKQIAVPAAAGAGVMAQSAASTAADIEASSAGGTASGTSDAGANAKKAVATVEAGTAPATTAVTVATGEPVSQAGSVAVPAVVEVPVATAKVADAPKPSVNADAGAKPAGNAAPTGSKTLVVADQRTKTPSAEPKIFVSPRAPDDPGPDAVTVEEVEPPMPRYGTSR